MNFILFFVIVIFYEGNLEILKNILESNTVFYLLISI